MSFQGDVAGIGLGELLQGLCRGGRDGVLTLNGEAGFACFLGLASAQIHFLAGPCEDTDIWRNRCQRAWVDFPDPHLENQRRAAIAHAARRETLFEMLDSAGLHFRFEPGPLPSSGPAMVRDDGLQATNPSESTTANSWGPGYSVEYLLLEHARISDEAGDTHACDLAAGDMPRALDATGQSEDVQIFLDQCNGTSTVEEIADRLGWPMRQVCGLIGQHVAAGLVRMADHRELMVAAQHELELGRIGRAAGRLERWIESVPPGPFFMEGEAELLLGEWQAERLNVVLNVMKPKLARGVLRRLDFVSPEREDALSRWKSLSECNRRDEIIAFKTAVLAVHEQPSEQSEDVAIELIKMARAMQDQERPWRARAVLRLAATQVFEKVQTRIELGTRMVQVGLLEESAPWILDAARELLGSGQAEKAIAPLRALAQADPDQREAGGLLIQARAHKTNVRRRRRNTLIGMAVLLMLSAGAMVRAKSQAEYDRKLTDITDLLSKPEEALQLLSQDFEADESPRVLALKQALLEQLERDRRAAGEAWLARFQQIEQEIEFGDPEQGLEHALELVPAPKDSMPGNTRRERSELLGMLASRMELASEELRIDVYATDEELREEQRLVDLLVTVENLAEESRSENGVEDFLFFIDELSTELVARRDKRTEKRLHIDTKQLEERQDLMLAGARAHVQAGDLVRAVNMYDRLLALEGSEELQPLLADELAEVRRHESALGRALERAQAGDHSGAKSELIDICPDLSEHIFPWRVESTPSGARARFRGDTVRVTPFVLYSSFGEELQLLLEMEGCEVRRIDVTDPGDLNVFMHRLPERAWGEHTIIEAAPVPVGEDHIVFDRTGRIARLQPGNSVRWTTKLETLGGIARTPVFLPRKPGYLLVLSEDGKAWFLRASDGQISSPFDFGKPPVEGPVVTRSGVSARFADGRVGLWSDRMMPQIFEDEGLFHSGDLASKQSTEVVSSNVVVLRRSADSDTILPSSWSGWQIEVRDEDYRVFDSGALVSSFTMSREGDWNFVAWEAPNALVPDGRVWVSDAAGIRSFRPAEGPLATEQRQARNSGLAEPEAQDE